MTPSECVRQLIPHHSPALDQASAFAPANIALCKYWGKRHEELKLPVTGSLSIALGSLGTRMRIAVAERDSLHINDQEQPADATAFTRFFAFLDLMRDLDTRFRVESTNTVPTGAGLASSASAFAAAVRCLNLLYTWQLSDRSLSILARLGSGSASRSIYSGFAEWMPGTRDDGLDSFAVPLDTTWPDFRIGILTLSDAKKSVGSTEGMRRTMETATLYKSWPAQVAKDLPVIREAVRDRDIANLGQAAEQNAMSMHATMIAAWPPVIYWKPESVAALHQVHALRTAGCPVYATMDAGPNVKLIFEAESTAQIQSTFPGVQIVAPFDPAQ